jgi:nicotinate-nucleotide pyrophosphorylase
VGLEQIAELARAGADVISVGALPHSAPAADNPLRLEPDER